MNERTVRLHRTNALQRLSLSGDVEWVLCAQRHRLIDDQGRRLESGERHGHAGQGETSESA